MILQYLKTHITALILLLLGVVFIMASVFLSGKFFTDQSNFIELQQRVQRDLIELETSADSTSRILLKHKVDDTNWTKLLRLADAQHHFLVYKNSTLFAWSENKGIVLEYSLPSYPRTVFANDGVYLVHATKAGEYQVFAYQRIMNSYKISNSFLSESLNENYSGFGIEELSKQPGRYNIHDSNGRFLFSVRFVQSKEYLEIKAFLGLFLFIIGLYFIVIALIRLFYKGKQVDSSQFSVLVIVFIAFVRALFFLKIPSFLFSFPIFYPYYYASSWFSSSLGDAFLNSLTILFITYFLVNQLDRSSKVFSIRQFNFDRFLVYYLTFLWNLVLLFTNDLVLNSSFEFVFSNPFEIATEVIIGLICIITMLSALIFSWQKSFQLFNPKRYKAYAVDYLLIFPAVFGVNYLINNDISVLLLVPLLVHLAFFVVKRIQVFTSSAVLSAVVITFISLVLSVYLYSLVHAKENSDRKLLLYAIESRNNNPLATSNFLIQKQAIERDTLLLAHGINFNDSTENLLVNYLKTNYFKGFWSQFNTNITLCQPHDNLIIKPEGRENNCYDYFNQIMGEQRNQSEPNDFGPLNTNQCLNGYLARIIINKGTSKEYGIFIEFATKLLSNDFSLPELFVDQRIIGEINLGNYSLARYMGANLLAKSGEFDYPQILNPKFVSHETENFINFNGYSHLCVKTPKNELLILSKPNNLYTDVFSTFTFVWLFTVLIVLLASSIYRIDHVFYLKVPTFYLSSRIQIFIILFIFASFAAIGFFSISFYRDFYERKNLDFVKDKVHSIQIEILSKISNGKALLPENRNYIESYLAKFASVFFTDIHIYNTNGLLYATSRPELFDNEFVSLRINPYAYQSIVSKRDAVYVTRETIGLLPYYSAYIPIVNTENQVTGIINVPFFARHAEFQRDVSKYLATFVNVFLFLSILAVLLAIIITNYFVKPLHTISRYFSQLTIGSKNITIPISRKDELGQLVTLYNSMVVQLDEAVNQLKERERESAWKDVAKQVAHEIKNPLTPIKLGLQFLMRAKQDNDPNWNQKFHSFSDTLLVQIESLAQLANSFSEFTKLPEPVFNWVEIKDLIDPSVLIVNDFEGRFSLLDETYNQNVYCDKNQIIRVLVNLLKNAQQAVSGCDSPSINMIIRNIPKSIQFEVKDNGIGIPLENQSMIFKPNFTTKSSGMGVGLFMSKVIVENHTGKIWFSSIPGQGTSFFVTLPIHLPADHP